MIVVRREKEPNSLLQFRKQYPDADYETDIPTNVLKDIREQMWEEQRHLCAYCMRKIDSPGVERIEHCRPRHPQDEVEHDKKATLDFKWMLGVCYGDSLTKGVNPEDTTCDAHRGNTELAINPFDELSVRKITRKRVLMEEKSRIMRKCKGKSQNAFIRELERTYESLVQKRNLTPYCGIIISWLETKLKIS